MDNVDELLGDLVYLRPFRADDVATLAATIQTSRPELERWMPWCHKDYGAEEAAQWIAAAADNWRARSEYSFAVIERGTEELVGSCGLNYLDWPSLRANLGYWVRTAST